jgi:inhibitor of KinA
VDDLEIAIADALRSKGSKKLSKTRTIDVPVCYDDEFALDLPEVAAHCRLPPDEVVRLHARAAYRVACVGFTPGFPYLSGLPDRLATPRRSTPRSAVPAGSVAIGGNQTGIYPHQSPGGWNIIGRTPLRLFDPRSDPPARLAIGDAVRFRVIAREEFDELSR